MALSREDKVERVDEYVGQLKGSRGLILVNYQGLNVNQMQNVRNAMRPMDSTFQVIKNRLMALALDEVGISLPDEWLTGPTAISFCEAEVPPVAKTLMESRKETGLLEIKGGWMDANVLSAEQVKGIADLPPREVLLAQVLGGINAPARQAAGVVAGGMRQIANVLQAYVDKLQEESPEQAAQPA